MCVIQNDKALAVHSVYVISQNNNIHMPSFKSIFLATTPFQA